MDHPARESRGLNRLMLGLVTSRVQIVAVCVILAVWTAACSGSDACEQATEDAATAAAIAQELSDRIADDAESQYLSAVTNAHERHESALAATEAGPEFDERHLNKTAQRNKANDELEAALAEAEVQYQVRMNQGTPMLSDALQKAEYADVVRVVACGT